MLFNLFTMLNLKILPKGFCSNAKGSSQPFNYDNPKALQMATVLQSISSLLVKTVKIVKKLVAFRLAVNVTHLL